MKATEYKGFLISIVHVSEKRFGWIAKGKHVEGRSDGIFPTRAAALKDAKFEIVAVRNEMPSNWTINHSRPALLECGHAVNDDCQCRM